MSPFPKLLYLRWLSSQVGWGSLPKFIQIRKEERHVWTRHFEDTVMHLPRKFTFFCVFEVLAFDLYQIYIYICIYIPALHVCMFWSSMHIPPILHMIPGFIHLVPYVLPANLCTEKLASAQRFSQRLRECIHWDVCKGWFVAGLTTSKLSVKLGQTMEKER